MKRGRISARRSATSSGLAIKRKRQQHDRKVDLPVLGKRQIRPEQQHWQYHEHRHQDGVQNKYADIEAKQLAVEQDGRVRELDRCFLHGTRRAGTTQNSTPIEAITKNARQRKEAAYSDRGIQQPAQAPTSLRMSARPRHLRAPSPWSDARHACCPRLTP